jgi:phage-related minor tail protein
VLLQQGGQLKDIFGSAGAAARALGGYIAGLVNPFTIAAAAVGILGYGYFKGREEAEAFQKTLILTGDAAGTTAARLSTIAASLDSGTTTQAKAAEVLNLFAQTGKVGAENFARFTKAAIEFEKAGGDTVENTVKAFSELGKSPLQASLRLTESTNYLTKAVYDQIKSLEEQGKATQAAKVAQDAYAASLEGMTPKLLSNLGFVEKKWISLTGYIKQARDAILEIGRESTPEQELVRMERILALKEAGIKNTKGTRAGDVLQAEADAIKENIRLAKQYIDIDKQRVDNKKADQDANKAAINLGEQAKTFYTDEKKRDLDREQAAQKRDAALKGLTKGSEEYNSVLRDYNTIISGINAKTPRTGDDEVANIKGKTAALREYVDGLTKATLKSSELTEGEKMASAFKEQIKTLEIKGVVGIEIDNKKAALAATEALIVVEKQARAKKITFETELKTDELLASSRELAKSLEDEFQMVGKSRLEQQNITTQRQIQLKYAKELRDLESKKDILPADAFETEKSKIKLAEQTESLANLRKTIRESAEFDVASLNGMFDGALDGAVKFSNALNQVVESQARLNKALRENARVNANDPLEKARVQAQIVEDSAKASLKAYASMIGGVRSYAKEGTKAYDALYNAEKVLRAFELASAVQTMAKKIGLLDLFVTKKVAGDAIMSTSTANNATGEIAANQAVGASTAALATAKQGAGGDPITAWPRMAAMAAVMASLGFAVGAFGSSSSGPATNEGKGTTFGDAGKASESFKNSLDILNSTQDVALNYTREMAMSLRSIDDSMAGLTNLYLRSTGVSDIESSIQTGKFDTALSRTLAWITNFTIGVMNPMIAAIDFALGGVVTNTVNSISRALFGGSTSIKGSGISANSQLLGDIMNQGFQGQYYADIETKKKLFGFSYSKSTSTKYTDLDTQLEQQFSAIFRSVGNTVSAAADLLQIETSQVNKRLQEYVVNIGRVDLKGLSGDAIAEKLSAVFGAESDKIARAAVSGFESIQQVGEGYFETLARVASQFELVRLYTERLGDTMQQTGVSGGLLADSIINVFGGLSEYQSAVQQYYEDFFTAEERGANAIIEMTSAMSYMGESVPETTQGFKDLVNAQDLTTESGRKAYATLISLSPAFAEMIKAAEDLKSGYREAIFTSAEMLAFNQQAVRDQFKNLGITGANVPETIAELRALVDAQDESTDAGKKLKFALMALAPSFVDVVNAQEEARQEILDAEKAAQDKITSERQSLEKQLLTATGNTAEIRRLELESLDASNRALQERIWALEDEKKAQQELAQASQGVTSEIDRLKKSLSGSTEAQSAAALQAQFATTTAQARSGDLTALSKLPTISSALDQAFQLTATTASEVARMKGYLAGSLAETLSILGASSAEKAISTISSVDLTAKTETDGLELTPTSSTTGLMSGMSSTAQLIEEISALRVDNQAQARAIVQLQSRLTKVVERWDIDGIPETRAVV